jgi:type III pantothenate kinase
MLLVVDIGNTNTSLGVYAGADLIAHWRTATIHYRTADEYGAFARQMFQVAEIDYREISDVVVASVVPPLNFAFKTMSQKYCR